MTDFKLDDFLDNCRQSSATAYAAFTQLLQALEAPKTQVAARRFLTELYHAVGQSSQGMHFQFIEQSILDAADQQQHLRLLQFPSTFLPEAWSFTFYEGLVRYPFAEYQNKRLVELGCGIGWISIALALRFQPKAMVGLDINPKAVTCAKLNMYLNGLDDSGNPVLLPNGQTLFDIMSFQQSDLLNAFQEKSNYFDKIIGCIPQVLNPEPEVMETIVAESASDEYLHSLSNYTAHQGYIEDQFGLGLIARAVEQSIRLLKSDGKLILNLGGRPGRSVLERLMKRRGFAVRRVWQTQVEQAADTDIDALVTIEQKTEHRFEFYLAADATTAIDAKTAQAYAKTGGKIYHSVDVYEAYMLLPDATKTIYKTIQKLDSDQLRSAVDLTYDNFDDAEERFQFLASLTKWLDKVQAIPYGDTQGLLAFRQQIAEFFNYYHELAFSEQQILITPGRIELFNNIIRCFEPDRLMIAKSLKDLIRGSYSGELLEVPEQVEFLQQLVEKLQPQWLITQLDDFEAQSLQHVTQLVECCQRSGTQLLIDISRQLELSSQPKSNGVLRFIAKHGLVDNVILSTALINNKVYQDYSLNIAISSNPSFIEAMVAAAELSYSRTPIMNQRYYANLFEELLYFQRTRVIEKSNKTPSVKHQQLALSDHATQAFHQPAIEGTQLNFDQHSIRLDYGENELPLPSLLKQILLESFAVRRFPGEEKDPSEPIRQLLHNRYGVEVLSSEELLFANGVAPLFSGLMQICAQENATLVFPTGSYGYFRSSATFYGVDQVAIATEESDHFKLTPSQLETVLQQHDKAWLVLNGPIVNPTGALYTQQELEQLLVIADQYQATVIIDAIFSGLEFDSSQSSRMLGSMTNGGRLLLMSGVSKEYSAGGLRFGYAWSRNRQLMARLSALLPNRVHYTLGYAMRELYQAFIQQEPSLLAHLQQQRELLSSRALRLTQVLTELGWQVLAPQGGLFLVAKPESFIQQHGYTPQQGADLMAEQLFKELNIAINNSSWTELPGYCRFVLATESTQFDAAIAKLQALSA